jgi:hypothetical protein
MKTPYGLKHPQPMLDRRKVNKVLHLKCKAQIISNYSLRCKPSCERNPLLVSAIAAKIINELSAFAYHKKVAANKIVISK